MDKLKVVLDLVRKGAITDEQAQLLLRTEKEYVYQPNYYQPYTYNWPWHYPNHYPFTYTAGLSAGSMTITTTGGSGDVTMATCGCGEEDCCSTAQAAAV